MERLKALLESCFEGTNLILVTNREPYIHKKTEKGIIVEKPAGGVTSALDGILKTIGGVWIAWGSGSADKDLVDEKNCISVPQENPSYILKRVWLSPIEVDNYYYGYSNQFLWPLCHITLDRLYFKKVFWEYYKKVNLKFSKAIFEEAKDNAIVWIHDYHFCILPQIIRKERNDLTIAHFWHIPWPDYSVFRICPHIKEIIEGMLGNDLILFQIPLFLKNFQNCVKECINADIDYSQSLVYYKGRKIKLNAFPISIDFERFQDLAKSERTIKLMGNLKKKFNLPKFIGIGVDRLEYTKGLLKRLQALELFFKKYKKFRQKFSFIQIAVPTRMKEPYISYKKAVEELIRKINNKFSKNDWSPIIFIDKKIEHEDLVAYYRMANVAIISSVYDGMNLVAKEYVASQIDEKGVLLLSEFAGASEELEGSILVNPYDIEQFAKMIKRALIMDEAEKKKRIRLLKKHIAEYNIYKWITDILNEIIYITLIKKKDYKYLFENLKEIKEKIEIKNIILFLDYDGTLTEIVSTPDKAILSKEIYSILIKLKKIFQIAIISGRSLKDIMEKIGIKDILYVGNHGSQIWDGKRIVLNQMIEENRILLNKFFERIKDETANIDGFFIEDKTITGSLHYRNVKIEKLSYLFKIIEKISKDYEDNFDFVLGKKVFEIRPKNSLNKGKAVSWIIENLAKNKYPIYIGDDSTDEDAYKVLSNFGISISLGMNPYANYFLKKQSEVKEFLLLLLKWI